jgi:flagellar basal-body rod modification protein FlgD
MTAASGAANHVVSGTTPLPTSSSSGSSGSSLGSTTDTTLAGNFQTFLTLLTTQLQNQNPLSPLDTNQFTQQLVQFASVEQQLKTNAELTTLVSLQQTAQSTQALGFVGKTAVVDGSTAALTNASATWDLGVPTNATLPSRSPTAPAKPSSPAATLSTPATIRPSPGTARATTARSGRMESTS